MKKGKQMEEAKCKKKASFVVFVENFSEEEHKQTKLLWDLLDEKKAGHLRREQLEKLMKVFKFKIQH